MKFSELSVSPIKLENKRSTPELDKTIEDINDLLYLIAFKPVIAQSKDYVLSKIESLANRLKTVKNDRSEEALNKLRECYKSLKAYNAVDDENEIRRVIKYQLAQFLKNKGNHTQQEILKLLSENKILYEMYGNKMMDANGEFNHFRQMQMDLINELERIYNI